MFSPFLSSFKFYKAAEHLLIYFHCIVFSVYFQKPLISVLKGLYHVSQTETR